MNDDVVVVQRDDLRALLDMFVGVCEDSRAEYGSGDRGRDAVAGTLDVRPGEDYTTQEWLDPFATGQRAKMGAYDRLRALVGEGDA